MEKVQKTRGRRKRKSKREGLNMKNMNKREIRKESKCKILKEKKEENNEVELRGIEIK